MKMLIGESLSKTYVEKVLLDNANFSIQEKERVGLIGVNGTGKSTLLKIIAGLETADAGSITTSNDYTIGFLSQQPALEESNTVMEQIFSKESQTNNIIMKYENCLLQVQENPTDEQLHERLANLQSQMDQFQAWDASANAKAVLNKLGINEVNQRIESLSGGQKKGSHLPRHWLKLRTCLFLMNLPTTLILKRLNGWRII